MKLFSFRKEPAPSAEVTGEAPPAGIVRVRGDAFFMRRLELPAGATAEDVAGFVNLQLEELAPFPLDQLHHGHVRSPDGTAVFLYAAYKRTFAPELVEGWPAAPFVLPDFIAALRLQYAASTVVLLRSDAALTAFYFEGGKPLPVRAASRPLAAEAPAAQVELTRRIVRQAVDAGTAPEVAWRATATPELRPKGLAFVLQAEGSGVTREVFIPTAECWTMDVRDPEFVARQRQRLGFDLMLWRIVQGAAAALALLVLGEVLLLAGTGYTGWVEHRVVSRDPAVQALLDKNEVASRLEEFGRSGIDPFAMLNVVANESLIRPHNIVLSSATARQRDAIELAGTAPNTAAVNAYVAALRGLPGVAGVNEGRSRALERGAEFQVEVRFGPGALTAAQPVEPVPDAAAVVEGGNP